MKSLFALAALTVLAALLPSQAGYAGNAEKFDPKRDPAKDLDAAMATAHQEHTKILLDVGGEWCIWCHRLDDFIAGELTLHQYMAEHYVVVKVNFSEENPNKSFLSRFPAIDAIRTCSCSIRTANCSTPRAPATSSRAKGTVRRRSRRSCGSGRPEGRPERAPT